MILFYILVIIIFSYVIINYILDNTAEKEAKEAILVDKIIDSFIDSNNTLIENYVLIFKIGDKTKKLVVSHQVYQKYKINDKGMLTYKRNKFLDFIVK